MFALVAVSISGDPPTAEGPVEVKFCTNNALNDKLQKYAQYHQKTAVVFNQLSYSLSKLGIKTINFEEYTDKMGVDTLHNLATHFKVPFYGCHQFHWLKMAHLPQDVSNNPVYFGIIRVASLRVVTNALTGHHGNTQQFCKFFVYQIVGLENH